MAQLRSQTAAQFKLTLAPLPTISQNTPFDSTLIKTWLHDLNRQIDEHLLALNDPEKHIESSLRLRTQAMDLLLTKLFCQYLPDELALFAVGGYGRYELFAHSDVDILILGETVQTHSQAIEQFVAILWDIGITPAISVRTLDETRTAINDQTIATAILEARLLCGNTALTDELNQLLKNAWSIEAFYHAKMSEAKERHRLHNATEYNLEPSVKHAPGGLRDIHILGWLGKFYQLKNPTTQANFITPDEQLALNNAERFFWLMRHHLHSIAKRCEDRLLFDHQKTIAIRGGWHTDDGNQQALTHALETMMHAYYQHAMTVAALSEMLCAYFAEQYLPIDSQITPLDDDFVLIKRHDETAIAAQSPDIFIQKPETLLKIFVQMGKHAIKKIHASTLRAIYQASQNINDAYRQNSRHQDLFVANLQENNYLFHRLRLMSRYGVLGGYLPAFAKITGLMQYDLFHRYTVDAHTLLLIRILHRFGDSRYDEQYGLVSEVYHNIKRPDILTIAAIFHDIAKGRGGDHSELGAVDVAEFCQSHRIDADDGEFITWLVREHLTMSLTAQKQDIADPEVIAKFAEFCGSITRLNYLYVLTVADMNATNSQLWNTWRASLLKQLYTNTHRALSLGLETLDKDSVINERKTKARALLTHLDDGQIDTLWQSFGEDYFLKQKHADIAWQADEILKQRASLSAGKPIIALRRHTDLSLGGIQLLLCASNQDNLFADTVRVLDELGLSVLDASILTADIDSVATAIDSYVLIDRFYGRGASLLDDGNRQNIIKNKLTQAIYHKGDRKLSATSFENKLQHFTVPTQIYFNKANTLAHQGLHQLQLVTKDRPALLAKLGQVFRQQNIEIHGARITTLGERAEDIFYISGRLGAGLSDDDLSSLKTAIEQALP